MALSAANVWECRASGASDNNGGGFNATAAGTDRSQQNAAQVAINNTTITTSITANVITFTGGYSPSAADVGNVVQMLTGTNVTAGFYEITSMVAGTSWTVTGAANLPTSGTTTNATGNMGGALATLGKLSGAMVASNKGYATGAFSATATTTFAQTVTPAGASPATRLIGYGSVRGDGGHATLTLATNTGLTGISATGNGFTIEQMDVDCASLGTSTGISLTGNYLQIKNCKVSNFTVRGINLGSVAGPGLVSDCEVTGGTAAATVGIDLQTTTNPAVASRCFVHDNACPGIKLATYNTVSSCLVVNNTGASSDGVSATHSVNIVQNTIHGNGRDGIRLTAGNSISLNLRNNILTNNGGYGLNNAFGGTAFPAASEYDGNAYLSNTSGARNGVDNATGIYSVAAYTNVKDVTLSASPYVGGTAGTSANFALNNTAGGGAACRAAGTPATWAGNTGTTGYPDMGAVQHRDSGTPGLIMATGS